MKPINTRVSFWLVITVITWLIFSVIYWLVPKSFKVTDVRDELFLEKSQVTISLVLESLFEIEKQECNFRNDNIYCRARLKAREFCYDSKVCVRDKVDIVLATNSIDSSSINASLYLFDSSEKERKFSKDQLVIKWPKLEQYILKTRGFYVEIPKTLNFSLIKNKKVKNANLSKNFLDIVRRENLSEIRNQIFLNVDTPKNYFEELESVLVSYTNRPNFYRSLYFSGITLLSIGYGDIVPVSTFGRMMAILEGFIGLVLMAIIAVVFYDGLRNRKGQE